MPAGKFFDGVNASKVRYWQHTLNAFPGFGLVLNDLKVTHKPSHQYLIKIEPAQVRLQPGIEDGYVWKPVPKTEHLFKEYLFTKQLSKHSIGAYMELYRGVGVSFEAAPLFNSGNMPRSEPEEESGEVSVMFIFLRRHELMSRLVRNYLHISSYSLVKD